jgi:hypothetical protein
MFKSCLIGEESMMKVRLEKNLNIDEDVETDDES